jgi:hypothetical protein
VDIPDRITTKIIETIRQAPPRAPRLAGGRFGFLLRLVFGPRERAASGPGSTATPGLAAFAPFCGVRAVLKV